MPQEYYEALELAKKIEKSALSPLPFKDKVEIASAIDFYPEEYVGLNYPDLINMYERVEKIKSAAKLEMYGDSRAPSIPTPESARRTAEVEENLKQMTDARLEEIKELEKQPATRHEAQQAHGDFKVEFEKHHVEEEEKPRKEFLLEVEKPAEKQKDDFEFETFEMDENASLPQKEETKEKEELGEKEEKEENAFKFKTNRNEEEITPEREDENELKPVFEGEEEQKPKRTLDRAAALEKPQKKTIKEVEEPALAVPEMLRAPQEAASGKYREVEEVLARESGGKLDEAAIKRKMLELTKELFRERSVSRREKIKLEIVVLKNMLSRAAEKPAGRSGAKSAKSSATLGKEYAANMLETLVSTQTTELSSKKDTLASLYKNRIDEIKKKFYSKVQSVPEENSAERKRIFGVLTFELKSLAKSISGDSKKVCDFLIQKHESEMGNLKKASTGANAKVAKNISLRLKQIGDYGREFKSIEGIINKNIETLIETASSEVITKQKKELEASAVVYDINETDEGTLLYFLHSKEPELYKKYERNHIAKSEALQYARFLLAKEKGLSNADIKRYFGDVSHLEA